MHMHMCMSTCACPCVYCVQVSWKAKLKEAFPNPNDYAEFMGSFSSATGAVTLGMMLLGQRIFKVCMPYPSYLTTLGSTTLLPFYPPCATPDYLTTLLPY